MLVLFETAAGYAVFKLLKENKLQETENLFDEFGTAEKANKILKIQYFDKFDDMTEALSAATSLVEGKINKKLKKLLKTICLQDANEQLAVADAKLGNLIKEKFDISCVCSTGVSELMRCIRSQADSLMSGLDPKEMAAMALGLAHSLSRYKLKFSPDKVDTMIVQAVSLLDDLDKELNNYVMRCREWYGWHFPELGKIIPDNNAYIRTVKLLGTRESAAGCDFSEVVPEDVEAEIKRSAEISMGTEISPEDILNITFLCDQIIEMTDYRAQLFEYLKNRMNAIAPNLTILIGELIGARLISHAGSLLGLAKHPASTVQILGAEKALFRAIKAKQDTPKYGLIYHAKLIGESAPRLKGKVARMLAAKASLACRKDALGDDSDTELGLQAKAKLESRLKQLEEGSMRKISGTGKMKAKMDKYESKSEIHQYPAGADFTRKRKPTETEGEETPGPSAKKSKTQPTDQPDTKPQTPGSVGKKKKKGKKGKSPDTNDDSINSQPDSSEKKKKHKREASDEDNDESVNVEPQSVEKKKKKKKKESNDDGNDEENIEVLDDSAEKKKKKKKKNK